MEIAIAIGSFILGYFAQKIFDFILDKLNRWQKHNKVRKRVNKIQKSIIAEESPILILARGNPIFKVGDVSVSIDNNKELFLAFPTELLDKLSTSSGTFANKDSIGKDICLEGFSNEELMSAIEISRLKIAQGFIGRKDGLYFNGKKYGVSYVDAFSRTCDEKERPILTIKLYDTDYFTHRVIEDATKTLVSNSIDFSLENLNNNYPFIRTSLGVSIIVVLESSDEIVLTYRSKNAAYGGKKWVYVSATESITETDFDAFVEQPRLDFCVKRGLLEELGIAENMYNANDIHFTDYFFEKSFLQDGIVAVVKINKDISFADLYAAAKGSKDFELEISDAFTVKNNKKEIESFIQRNAENVREQTKFALNSYCARL